MNVDECKPDEEVTLKLVEIITNGDEYYYENLKQGNMEVKTNDDKYSAECVKQDGGNNKVNVKQENNENDKSDNSTEIKFEMVKETNENSESRDSIEGSENLKEDPLALPELKDEHNGAEGLEISEIEPECKNEVEESKVSESKEQSSNSVQDIIVSNADHTAYDSNVMPEHYVIHESAVLGSSDYAIKGENINQENSNSKDSDSKTVPEASTDVGSVSDHEESKAEEEEEEEEEDAEEVQAALIAAAVAGSDRCCWDMVDSTEKFLAEVPVVALEAVPVPVVPVALAVVDESEAIEEVEVIPMKEELEVRLEEGTFPVASEDALSMDWPYAVKMDPTIVAAALGETGDGSSSAMKTTQAQYPEYSTSQAVKLELEGKCNNKIILINYSISLKNIFIVSVDITY